MDAIVRVPPVPPSQVRATTTSREIGHEHDETMGRSRRPAQESYVANKEEHFGTHDFAQAIGRKPQEYFPDRETRGSSRLGCWRLAALAVALWSGQVGSLLLTAFSLIAIALVAKHLLPPKTIHFQPGKVFSGVARLASPDQAWIRHEGLQVAQEIGRQTKSTTLLCGPSGAGKSTVIHLQILPRMRAEGWIVVAPDDLATFRTSVVAKFAECTPLPAAALDSLSFKPLDLSGCPRTLLVLDQAEQLLRRSLDEITWIAGFLSRCLASGTTHLLLCVRSEFYLPLRNLLGPIVPEPDKVCWLTGFELTGSDSTWIREKLGRVVRSPAVVKKILADLASRDLVWSAGDGAPAFPCAKPYCRSSCRWLVACWNPKRPEVAR